MRKEFKSVLIGDNICVVDEKAELKRGDNYVRDNMIWLVQPSDNEEYYKNKSYPKIIAATNNSDSFMSTLPRLVIKDEVDVQEMANDAHFKRYGNYQGISPFNIGFLDGFRANKKEFTREDIFYIAGYASELSRGDRFSATILDEKIKNKINSLHDSSILLIEVDSSGNPIITDNQITAFKK